MAISAGFFISGATSTGLCSGPFTFELFTTTLPLIVGSDLFMPYNTVYSLKFILLYFFKQFY